MQRIRSRAASTSPTTPRMHSPWQLFGAKDFGHINATSYFKCLPHTLGLGPEVWRVLDKCHQIRNLGEYEGDLNIDERIVADLITACQSVAAKLETT
jgi:hypothetical protein